MEIPLSAHDPESRWRAWYSCASFLALWAIALTCTVLLAQPVSAATATTVPSIAWDSSMLNANQNANLPWGPVGEQATVHGSGFATGTRLTLVLVPGDSNKNASLCSQAGVSVASVSSVPSTGLFSTSFLWPAAAGKVGQIYSICAQNTSHAAVSTHDSGPFTLLASSPSIHISVSSVATGGSVTITGNHWVPPQPVTVVIGNCGNCLGSPSNTFITNTVTSSGLNAGVFRVTLQVPNNFQPNTYSVEAYAGMNTSTKIALLDANNTMSNGLPRLKIALPTIAPVTPSTASPTPTATAAATRTATATVARPVSTPASPTSQNANHFPLALILGLLLPLTVAVLGLLIYMFKKRSKDVDTPSRVVPSLAGQFHQSSASYQVAYGFQPQPSYAPEQFANVTSYFSPEPTQPLNYPSEVPQPKWLLNYTNEAQPPTLPQNAATDVPQQPRELPGDPLATASQDQEATVNAPLNPGFACLTCGTQLPVGALFCGHCGTLNGNVLA